MDYLYSEHSYGPARLADRLAADRLRIIAYATANPTSSVVDTTIADPNLVLSTNSYEKGGWTLQMLRVLLGDETFFDALRSYYEQYRYGNATTRDFEKVVESVSGKDLRWFFDQWIYRPGVPDISVRSRYDANGRQVVLDVEQKQKLTYRLQLEVEIAAGQQESTETVELTQRRQTIRIKVAGKPDSVRLDPNVKILAHIATG
jgi:aminopeptidase N